MLFAYPQQKLLLSSKKRTNVEQFNAKTRELSTGIRQRPYNSQATTCNSNFKIL